MTSAAAIEVGFSKRDITPLHDRQTIYSRLRENGRPESFGEVPIRDKLCARCLVLRNPHRTFILLTLDLLGVRAELRRRVIESLNRRGIHADHLSLSATHTHTAPTVVRFHGIEPTPEGYADLLEERVVEAVADAVANAKRASLSATSTEVDLSVNRRQIGRLAEINDPGAPSGLVDPQLAILRIDVAGGDTALFVTYTGHPLTMSANVPLISADYPGALVRMLEAEPNVAFAQFLQGCAGNINMKIHGDAEESETVARELARAILDAGKNATSLSSSDCRCASRIVHLPWDNVDPDREGPAGQLTPRGAAEWAADLHKALNGDADPCAHILMQAVRIGDAVLLFLPGEVFAEIGLAIKKHCPTERLFVAAYSNNCEVGYIPTAAAFAEGGYEVDSAPYYYGVFRLSPQCERIVVDAARKLIDAVSS